MATYIRTLTDYESNYIYPNSTSEAIKRQDGHQNGPGGTTVESTLQYLEGELLSKATLASVNTAIDTLLGTGAAASLQTLQSLSTALGDDTNFAQNVLNALNTKQDLLTPDQCGTSLLASGIDTSSNIPTSTMVKTYVDNGLNARISAIVFDGSTYAPLNNNTVVSLNTNAFIKSNDAGTAQSPVPINANTLQGHDYNDLLSELTCEANENTDNTNYPIVCWDENYKLYNYSELIYMNPSTGNITANKVYNAVYNDYAEWFEKDDYTEIFKPGDVCVWTGNGVTKSTIENDTSVIGICSNTYGHIVGGEQIVNMEDNNKKFVPIGLTGRVKVNVIGPVEIGDILVTGPDGSAIVNNDAKPNMIIGKSLETSYGANKRLIQILI